MGQGIRREEGHARATVVAKREADIETETEPVEKFPRQVENKTKPPSRWGEKNIKTEGLIRRIISA